jgi:DNA-binding response OmpR family regulator
MLDKTRVLVIEDEEGIRMPLEDMLRARGANMDVVIGLRQGADDYLPKPFEAEILVARMEALLRRSAGAICSEGTSP